MIGKGCSLVVICLRSGKIFLKIHKEESPMRRISAGLAVLACVFAATSGIAKETSRVKELAVTSPAFAEGERFRSDSRATARTAARPLYSPLFQPGLAPWRLSSMTRMRLREHGCTGSCGTFLPARGILKRVKFPQEQSRD